MDSVLALLQSQGGMLHPDSQAVAATAAALCRDKGWEADGVIMADGLGEALEHQLRASALERIYVYTNARFASFIAQEHLRALLDLIQKIKPGILLAPATPEGRALASMAASALKTGVTADCTALSIRADGLLLQTRPAFGGNVMANILTPSARPQIATLRYASVPQQAVPTVDTAIIPIDFGAELAEERFVRAEWADVFVPRAGEIDTIIALGAGLAAREDVALFEQIARKNDAALLCSRALVERGWFPRSRQIGLSGSRIDARLLVTFGISGSVQFMAGIRNIRKLIAINTDENAPIMKVADIPLAGDLYEIARAIIETNG